MDRRDIQEEIGQAFMKKSKTTYYNIDMEQTGLKLKKIIKQSGYDVKAIQEILHLSCPQPIYR